VDGRGAAALQTAGWVKSIDPTLPGRPIPPAWLVVSFWAATILFSLLHGLMYGARAAFYMDLSDPKVGATQFTAYMAVLNLVIAYSAYWQGKAIGQWGYPKTLMIDAIFGCVGVAFLPWCARRPAPQVPPEPVPPVPVLPATH
jgi:MFS transporter, PAT family, beta-lactamase induction signal transducer AmpG